MWQKCDNSVTKNDPNSIVKVWQDKVLIFEYPEILILIMESIEAIDKECSALGGLFQQVVNDMKVRNCFVRVRIDPDLYGYVRPYYRVSILYYWKMTFL